MRSLAAFTTFNEAGYERYGRRMLESFDARWPQDVRMYAYHEGALPPFRSERVHYRSLTELCPDLLRFKERHRDSPRAHGKVKFDPRDDREHPQGIGFRWDAVRFSHKSYCICHATRNIDADVAFWLDADVRTFESIPREFLEGLVDPQEYCSYLGREGTYSETGFLGFNLRHPAHEEFMRRWKEFYDTDAIFDLKQWHDCEVFDTVRRQLERERGLRGRNLTTQHRGHPFINSCLGRYMDHLKGERKDTGRSWDEDLVVDNLHPYWADAPSH